MRQQPAAQAVIEELLRLQGSVPPRSRFARVFGHSPLGGESSSWYRGAQGEIIVGGILATLPPEWTAFHALPVGKKGADIDHLVIGPGGIFTINTKHHKNKPIWVAGRTLMVSGQKQPHIPSAEFEAKRVTKLVTERMPDVAPAQPILTLVNPKSLSIKTKPKLVKVVAAVSLRRWLLARPAILSSAELAELEAIIDDPATWPPGFLPPSENARECFDALDREVRVAAVRRALWRLFGTAVAVVALIVVGPPLLSIVMDAYIAAVMNP